MTNGISPKVSVPVISNVALGALLIVLWMLSGSRDLADPLFVAGCSFLGAGGLTFGAGYRAGPGDVVQEIGAGSDEALSDLARDRLGV